MNRRNFFKTVTGFVTGLYAAFMPKVKGISSSTGGRNHSCSASMSGHPSTESTVEPDEELFCHGGYLFRTYPYQDDGVYVILKRENIYVTRILEKYMFSRIGFRRMHCDDMINCFESFQLKHKV